MATHSQSPRLASLDDPFHCRCNRGLFSCRGIGRCRELEQSRRNFCELGRITTASRIDRLASL